MLTGAPTATQFWDLDGAAPSAIALLDESNVVTYGELDDLVGSVASTLGSTRRLVLLEASTTVDFVTSYLGALRGGHPVLVVPPCRVSAIAERFDPDVVISAGGSILERRQRSAHDLHPDLALLMSTSGSTGTPKLVRLSRESVDANTRSIAEYLELTASDRAITTLPLSYCYGLSVLQTHLAVGASVVLDERSVTEQAFWHRFLATAPTSLAGVPHTFELLERVGFEDMELPSLRYVTQAGGKMAPDRVRRFAQLGERRGWDLFVMYGQTEATARMAYLPPALAATNPASIGVAIPGGELTIEDADQTGVGELVYRGANVMMGYASEPADLALPAGKTSLRTRDLARRNEDGLFEIVGRRSRFVKPFGLRIDLDHLECALRAQDVEAACTGDDTKVVVAAVGGPVKQLEPLVRQLTQLPPSAVSVVAVEDLPRLASGKVDYAAVSQLTAGLTESGDVTLRDLFSDVLGVEARDEDSFVSLGGDSLSYIEVSMRLEQRLGFLPADWHTRSIADLVTGTERATSRRPLTAVDTTLLLRALAIALVVGGHVGLWHIPGGAHALFAVAGFNFARFQLRSTARTQSLLRVVAPSMAWIGAAAALTDEFNWKHALLVRGPLGERSDRWAYWFVEALVFVLLACVAAMAIRPLRDYIQRRPFAVAMGGAAVGLTFRFDVFVADPHRPLYRPQEIFWLFALGAAAAAAVGWWQRCAVLVVGVAAVIGGFGDIFRDLVVLAALVALVCLSEVRVPAVVAAGMAPVASASLYIYLTHFQVFPVIRPLAGSVGAFVASMVVGIVVARVTEPLLRSLLGARRERSVGFELEEVVEGLPSHDDARLTAANEHDRRARHAVVVRRHRVAVGAGHRRRQDVADGDSTRKVRISHDHVA